jgi:hypothetical protein
MSSFCVKFCGLVARFFSHRGIAIDAKLRRVRARALKGEDDVVGGERRAIVEPDAGAEVEAPGHRINLLPGHRKFGPEVELLVTSDEELVDELVHIIGEAFVLRMRIGRLRIAAVGPAERLGIPGAGRERRRDEGECEQAQHDLSLRMKSEHDNPARHRYNKSDYGAALEFRA